MAKHNETTLARAARFYGPLRTEHAYIRAAGRCAAAMGELTDALLRLQDGLPVLEVEIGNALTKLEAAIPDLWVAAERVGALVGQPFNAGGTIFFSGREAALDELETKLKRAADRAGPPRPAPAPGTPLFDKHEVLDMICTIAAREAAQKEKEAPDGKPV